MDTHMQQFPGHSAHEARLLRKLDPSQRHYVHRMDEDPRVNDMQRREQSRFLDDHVEHHIHQDRLSLARLFGFGTDSRIAQEGRLQAAESVDEMAGKNAARIATALFTSNSVKLKKSLKDTLGSKLEFTAQVREGGHAADRDFTVDLSLPVWKTLKNENRIAQRLEGRNIGELKEQFGITVDPGKSWWQFWRDGVACDILNADEARAIAKLVMVRFTRGILGQGLVSENNIGQAQHMLFERPDLIGVLGDSGHAKHEVEVAEAKKTLSEQLEELRKPKPTPPRENFPQAQNLLLGLQAELTTVDTQRTHLADDLVNLEGGPVQAPVPVPNAGPGTLAANVQLLPGAVLPQGAIMTAGTLINVDILLPEGTVLPGGATGTTPVLNGAITVPAGGLVIPAGATLTGGLTIPRGTVLTNGIILPAGTQLPGGATMGPPPVAYTFRSAYLTRRGIQNSNQVAQLHRDRIDQLRDRIEQEQRRLESERTRITTEQNRLGEVINHYQKLRDTLEQIHAQIPRAEFRAGPAAFTNLFTAGNAPRVDMARINADLNLVALADLVADHCGKLGKPEQYAQEVIELKKHAKEHKETPPVGAKAVIDVYRSYFKEGDDEAADLEAKKAAWGTFLENELSKHESDRMEIEIDRWMNSNRTLTGRFLSGVGAVAKGVVRGSDEAFMCKLAESPEVQVPIGTGTGATKFSHGTLEAGTFAGVGAGIGAGLLSTGIGTAAGITEVAAIGATGFGTAAGLLIPGAFATWGISTLLRRGLRNISRRDGGFWRKLRGVAQWTGAAGILTGAGAAAFYGTGTAISAILASPVLLASLSVPPVAAAAGLGALSWGVLKATGLDRRILGSRSVLGWLWPRWGARPAWGAIRHDRVKLKVAWDGMRKGIESRELSTSEYVRDQLCEVGRMALMSNAKELGETLAETKMTDEEFVHFCMENKRRVQQRETSEMVHNGFGKNEKGGVIDPMIDAAAEDTVTYAKQNRPGPVRDTITALPRWWSERR